MKKALFTAILLTICLSLSAKEPMSRLADRVFERAGIQFRQLCSATAEDKLPYSFKNGNLVLNSATGWTSGFFPGSLWLVYEYTKDESFRELAAEQSSKLSGIVKMKTHHDIGFQTNCSLGNAYRLTGDGQYFSVMKDAATKLAGRYSPVTEAIKSWDNDRWDYPVIIDNMMNLELLLSVGTKTGCDSLVKIARAHANTTMKNHFREDYSTYHLVAYDPVNGGVGKKQTVQGFSDESCWSRGQAWALYGYTMMYRYTKDSAYLQQARNIAAFILPMLPEDGIPEWDFNAPGTKHAFTMDAKGAPDKTIYLWKEGDKVLRDASAAAVMASAFVELSGYVKGEEKKNCLATAEKMIRTLASDEYLAEAGSNGGFLLMHTAVNVHSWKEVDNPVTYADYYFLEALSRYINAK